MSLRRALLATLFLLTACQPGLDRQLKAKDYSHEGTRPLPTGVVPQEQEQARPALTEELLKSGRTLFDIHCAVCHGLNGDGDGLAVKRGFPAPPPLARFKSSSAEMEQIIAGGRGRMSAMANRLSLRQRWAIVAYVRALQIHDGSKRP